MLKKKGSLFLVFLLLVSLIPTSIFAHKMSLTLEEPGVLKAEYDGGGFSPRTTVTIYDDKGEVLDEGKVDKDGKFHFDPSLKVAKAEAQDGMGHAAEYEVGKEEVNIPKVPVIIGVFVVIIGIFWYFNKKKK